MAELNQDSGGGKKGGGKIRSKKAGGKVDLTAMVDLAFLLITFFMLTTSLNKPNAMDVTMPVKPEDDIEAQEVEHDRTVTVLIGSENKIVWYYGEFTEPLEGPTETDFSREGIRQVLLEKLKEVPQKTGKDLITVIRPSEKSTHRNFVDILDEMKIVDAQIFTVGTITEAEIEFLKEHNLYND